MNIRIKGKEKSLKAKTTRQVLRKDIDRIITPNNLIAV
jgi:hypothetical protein